MPTCPLPRTGALFPVLILVLLLLAGTVAKAQEPDAELIAASKSVGLGDNPYQEALVLKNIKQIHQLRSEGRISVGDYQRLMAWHQIENLTLARRAAASLGLVVVPQSVDPSKGEYRDGSDSDYHVRRKDGQPLTLEDVQAVERAYRQQVNQEVKTRSTAGGRRLAPPAQTFDTATDFMAAVNGTSEAEFNRIAAYFNSKGADTYSRYGAAVVESQLRSPGSTVDLRAGGMYVNEMIEQAAKKQAKIDKVRAQLATGADPQTAQRLLGQLAVLTLERDKYIDRINQVNTKLSQQAGLPPPAAVGPESDWRNAGRAQYVQTLGNIAASSPDGSDMRRYSRFILALQIYDMPEDRRRAYLAGLDPAVRPEVDAQVKQFQEQEQTRVSADRLARLQKFLGQTETGRKLMAAYEWVFTELTRERSRATQSSQFIGDVYGDLSAVNQRVGDRAMQLSLWLDVLKQVRDASSDADLAIALGRTLASNTYYGMIASYVYTGLVEGDSTALAKALIILICPQAALPQVVQSIGDSAIDLTSTVLFDQQFLALYAAARFDPKSGSLLSIGEYGGSSAACQFLDDALSPGGYVNVEGVFARALDLAKEKNLSVEMLSGADRAGAMALTRAFTSTVYGGAPQVMKDNAGLLDACGQVRALTSSINDFVAGLGQPGTVSMDVDENWTHPKLEAAAQGQLSRLLRLRSAGWPKVKKALCDGIKANLETRNRANVQLDKGDQELLDMLARVERLFRELEMYDLGMSWLNYDSGFNFIERNLFVSTKEQKLKRMEVLQRYFAAYSAVLLLRDSAEGTYVAYGGRRLTPRPLTGTPLMTADPTFDRATAGTFVQESMQELSKTTEFPLLWTKRDSLNDNSATLDSDFDKRILGGIFSTVLIIQNNEAIIKGAAHSQSRLYKVQVPSREDLHARTEEAYANISMQRKRSETLIEEFKEYYKKRDPALAILPPPAVIEQRAVAETEYAFRLAASNVPADVIVTWYDDSREIGKGSILQHAFPTAGVYRLRVAASWVKSERVKREGKVTADLRCVIGEPGSDVGKKPALSIVLPRELAAGPGVTGKVYPFGVNATNIPEGAVYSWLKGLDPLKTGKSVELSFAEAGAVNLSVSAVWVVEGSAAAEEMWARASFKVVNPAGKPPADVKKPGDTSLGAKAQPPVPTPSPAPVQDQPTDSSVVTFGGTVPGIWDGGNNPRGFDFKRQNAKTTGTGDCKWNAEVQSDISGRIDPSGSANTPEEITKRINDVVASSKARWGATAAVRPFAIGDFKGQFVDTSVVFLPGGWSDGGFRADAVIAGGRGWLIKGRHTVEVAYSVSGSGCWTNVDQAFLMSQASAAQADAKSIVASLTLVEKGSFTRVPYTGPKLDGSDMPKVTLSPPALEKLKIGDAVKVSVVVENAKPEDRPFRYGWAGDIEGKPGASTGSATITIRPKKPGRYPLSVSVDGARYNLGSASLEYEVADLKAEITQQSPATKSVAVGMPVTFSARLLSGGVPITGNYVYRWQPTPEVAFQPGEGPATQTKAVFSRPGVTKVWVQILEKKGTVLTTVAESSQLDIDVVNPEITLRMVPAEPYPGQQVRITASETPAMGDALITYWWEYAGSVLNPGAEANPRVYSFIPKDKTPVTVTAHAKAKDGGDDLGTKAIVVTARPHNVKVTGPTSRGPKPQVWSAQAGRLVDEEQQIAVFQDVSMRADVTPAPVNLPLHYQWTASPESCSISNAISQEPTFNCSQTGSVAAVVTVRDNLGATLGTGTGTISVSISQASLRKSQAQADAAKQAAQQATLAAERKAAAVKQGQASTPPPVVASPTGTNVVVFKNTNIGGVSNSPSAPTQFTISRPHVISYVFTYHWNDGNGSARTGTIALRHANGAVFGPWAATGTPGQGGVPNAGWEVRPNVVIPAGTYTIIDSSPSTWAQNSESGGRGHTIVEGHTVTATTSATPMVTAPPNPPVAPAPAPDRQAPGSPASKLPISESAVVKAPAAAAPNVSDRVPATGGWVLERTEFVVEKVDPESMQKWQPAESGADGAGSAGVTIGGLKLNMKVAWNSPPKVLVPGRQVDVRLTISDAGSDQFPGMFHANVRANCPALSAVWYGPEMSLQWSPGERSKEASKAYTPPSAAPGTTMYITAAWSVGFRTSTFYYFYKFTLDASKAPAPVSTSSAPSAIRPAASSVVPPPPPTDVRGVGTWSVSFNGWAGVMELTERGGANQGRFSLGGGSWEPMLDLRIEGSAISFRRTGGDQRYVGVVSGSAMRGTFSQGGAGSYPWTATKK